MSLSIVQVPRRFVEHEWGGTETTILQSSRALNAMGNRSEVRTTMALCDRREETMEGVRIRRYSYLYPFWGLSRQDRLEMDRKGGNLLSVSLLASLLTKDRPDILHAHSGKRLGGIVRTAARLRRIPYVISLHGNVFDVPEEETEQMLQPLKGAFEWGRAAGALLGARRVLQDADAIICVGQNEQRAVQAQLPGQRVEWLPNGVDAGRFADGNGDKFRASHAIPHDRKLLLCVGRIDNQKNQVALLHTLSELLRRGENAHLALIGPVTVESYRETLIRTIKEQGLENRISLIPGLPGGSPELVDAYHAADVFCLPSRHEPFGIVILEAWAAGLPVISAPVGGIPTFTNHREDILHADPGQPEQFADAIQTVLSDSRFAEKLAKSGLRRAKNEFDWSCISARLENLYRDLIRT